MLLGLDLEPVRLVRQEIGNITNGNGGKLGTGEK